MAEKLQPGPAEHLFRQGLANLDTRSYQQAAGCFQQALDLDRDGPAKPLRMKFLSYLGLALTMAHGRSPEAIKMCEQAARREFYDADLFCNLGIVYMRNRQRGKAFKMFQRGLALRPTHRRILAELDRHDRRTQPLFGFLPRNHTLNRIAGRLVWRLRDLFDRTAQNEV